MKIKQRYVFALQVNFAFFRRVYHVSVCFEIDSDVPGKPKDVEADPFAEECVKLSWIAPEDDGGSYIMNYVVEKLDPDTNRWVRALSSHATHCMIDGLVGEKTYQFRVIAENVHGAGEPSEPSKAVFVKGLNA